MVEKFCTVWQNCKRQGKNVTLYAFLSLFCLFGVSGCSLFDYIQRKATQGNIIGNDWQIAKIIVGDEVFYAPQMLAKIAKYKLDEQDQENSNDDQNTEQDAKDFAESIKEASKLAEFASLDRAKLQELARIDEVATLNFDIAQGRISGQSGCGSYFASYVWSDKKHIEITAGNSTRKICSPNEISRFEFRLIRGFEGNFSVSQSSKTNLLLENQELKIYLYRQ